MTTLPTQFHVQFPTVPGAGPTLAVPPQPAGPADKFMAGVVTQSAQRKQLVCKDLLDPASRAQAEQTAPQVYQQMLANTQIFMNYGKDAIAGMNVLIDRMLKEVGPVDIPQLTTLMKGLNDNMRTIKSKYDVSVPQVRARLQKMLDGAHSLWGQGKSLVEMFMEDVMSIEQQIDRVKAQLGGKEIQMCRNVALYDQLYTQNEQEIMNVIGAIAIMEMVRELAANDASAITVDPNDPAQRTASEHKRLLTEFIRNLDIKIMEYKNRLFVGWTTSPNITNMRTLDVSLAQKLDLLMNLTIPVMKGTILQWRMSIQAQQAAQMDQVVVAAANEWLTTYSRSSAQTVELIADTVETPSLTPATITAMAQAIQDQSDSLVKAYESGRERRAVVNDAILSAQRVIQNATKQVSDQIVDDLAKKATAPIPAVLQAPAAA